MIRSGLLLLTAILLLNACDKNNVIFDAKQLKNKSADEVVQILGEPDTTYNKWIMGKEHYILRYFRLYDTEVRELKGKTTAVLVHEAQDLGFKPTLIEQFGFSYVEPQTIDQDNYYSWKNLEGLENVSMYKVGKKMKPGQTLQFDIYFDLE